MDDYYTAQNGCLYPIIRFRAVYKEKIYYSNAIDLRFLANFNKDGEIKYFTSIHGGTAVLPPQPPPPAPARRRLQGSGIPNPIDEIEKIANKAVDLVDDIKDAVEDVIDKIVTIYPSKFTFQFAALATKGGSKGLIPGLNADSVCGDITCTTSGAGASLTNSRPTVCSNEEKCSEGDADCWTPFQDDCPAFEPIDKAWANACRCSALKDGKYHCNFASGFCQAGPSPFVDALPTCPESGAQLQNRLCRVSEAWKCAGLGQAEELACRVQKARAATKRLCRAFCDDLPHMDGNFLTAFVDQCVCEVGADRLSVRNVTIAVSLGSGGRKLLQIDPGSNSTVGEATATLDETSLNDTEVGNATHHYVHIGRGLDNATGFTRCERALDCASSSVTNLRVCRSLWGTPIPCFSCSERTHALEWGDGEGFGCDPETRTCACSAPPPTSEFTDEVVDMFEWRGNSWCDRVMRGYHTHAVTAPIERASILRCTMLRAAGESASRAIGLPTIPSDIFYNPVRLLWIARDLFEGLTSYVMEGFDDRPVEEFFTHLVQRRVDPVLVFKVLETAQHLVRRGAEMVQNANVTGAIEQAASGLSPTAAGLLHESFDVAREVVTKTSFSTATYARLRWTAAAAAAPMARLAFHTAREVGTRRRLLRAPDVAPRARATVAATRSPQNDAPPRAEARAPAIAANGSLVLPGAGDGIGACTTGEIIIETFNEAWGIARDHYGTPDGFERSVCLFERHLYQDTRVCRPPQPARHPTVDFSGARFGEEGEFRLPPEIRGFVWPPLLRDVIEGVVGRVSRAITRLDERGIRDFVSGFTTCDWETVSCSKPKRYSVGAGLVVVQSICTGVPMAMSFLDMNVVLVASTWALGQAVAPVFFMYLVYDVSPLCFPAIPTCLVDDLFEFFDHWTPRFIQWPAGLVRRPWYRTATLKRLLPGAEVIDCTARDYLSPFDTFAWGLRWMEVEIPAVVRRWIPELARADDRRAKHVGEDAWCSIVSTGPYAMAVATAVMLTISACAQPATMFAASLARTSVMMFRWTGKLLYEVR